MGDIMPPGPLAYQGAVSVPYILRSGAPSSSNTNFPVPTIWVDYVNKLAYLLVSVASGTATWLELSQSSGAPLSVPDGGTGDSSFTAYALLCGGTSSTGALQTVSGLGSSGQILTSSGASALPAWTTATYPATTTINQLLYSSAANTVAGISTANNGVLVTSSGGVPSISSTLPAAVQGNITSVGNLGNSTNATRSLLIAYQSSSVTNQTGDGTAYTVIFDTVVEDQAGNYNNSTGTFTFPKAGYYLISSSVLIQNGTSSFNISLHFSLTGGTQIPYTQAVLVTGNNQTSGTTIYKASANDTLTVVVIGSGSTKTLGVYGGTDSRTALYVTFLC